MGRKKRLKRKLKNWWIGYIDFSSYKIKNYQYVKSTYKNDIASSLITEDNIRLIEKLIPEYKVNEKLFYKICRRVFDRKKTGNNVEDSFLFHIYCNGFTSGFKKIDKIIKKENIAPSIESLQKHIELYIEDLDDVGDYELSQNKKNFDYIDFLVDIGHREGAFIRGTLYQKEISKEKIPSFKDYLQTSEELKEELIKKTKKYFIKPRKGKEVAIFLKAMWINKYLLEYETRESIYRALENEIGYSFGNDRSGINKVLNINNNYNIEEEAKELAKRLKI